MKVQPSIRYAIAQPNCSLLPRAARSQHHRSPSPHRLAAWATASCKSPTYAGSTTAVLIKRAHSLRAVLVPGQLGRQHCPASPCTRRRSRPDTSNKCLHSEGILGLRISISPPTSKMRPADVGALSNLKRNIEPGAPIICLALLHTGCAPRKPAWTSNNSSIL